MFPVGGFLWMWFYVLGLVWSACCLAVCFLVACVWLVVRVVLPAFPLWGFLVGIGDCLVMVRRCGIGGCGQSVYLL